jgi:hypothetical protein
VLGGLGLMAFSPVIGFFVFLLVCIFAVFITTKIWKKIARGIRVLRARFGKKELARS